MAEEEQEQQASSGGNKIVMIIGGVVLFILIAIGGIIAMLLSGGEDPANAANAAPTQKSEGGTSGLGEDVTDVRIDQTYLKVGTLYELDQFIVNLISRQGKRYLRTKISLEINNDSLTGELEVKKPVIKDIILSILTSKTVEDLSTIKGKTRAKKEIIATINKSLLDGKITNMFFTEFIIQ